MTYRQLKKTSVAFLSLSCLVLLFQNCSGKNSASSSSSAVDQGNNNDNNNSISEKVVDLSVLGNRTCAVMESGSLKCWGAQVLYGNDGHLDFGKIQKIKTPKTLAEFGKVKSVAGNASYVCALTETNKVKCFGEMFKIFSYTSPSELDKAENVTSIQATNTYLLIQHAGPTAKFIGEFNPEGVNNYTPYKLAEQTSDFFPTDSKNIKVNASYFCIVATEDSSSNYYGKMLCLGNYNSPFGAANTNGIGNVIETIPAAVKSFAVADNRVCVVTSDSQIYCWLISVFQAFTEKR